MSQENKPTRLNGPDKGEGPRKGPKFSIYWIYAIIAAVLLLANFYRGTPKHLKWSELDSNKKCLLQGDVEKLDLVKNKDKVRVYIKQDSLYKKFYADKLQKTVLSKDKLKTYPCSSLK
jgi:AFG3 family protein